MRRWPLQRVMQACGMSRGGDEGYRLLRAESDNSPLTRKCLPPGLHCIHNHEIKIEISLHSRSRTPAHTGFPTNPKRIRSARHLNYNGASNKERRRGAMMAKMAEKLAHVKGPVEYFPIKAPP